MSKLSPLIEKEVTAYRAYRADTTEQNRQIWARAQAEYQTALEELVTALQKK